MTGTTTTTTTTTAPLRIAITGEFRRGKDTVADMLTAHLSKPLGAHTYVTRLAFADELKRELADMTWGYVGRNQVSTLKNGPPAWEDHNGWNVGEIEARGRNGSGWQWWGEYRRLTCGEDYWVKHPNLQAKFTQAVKQGNHILLTDLRHHNEAEWCRDHGFFLLRIEGPCQTKGEVRDRNHPSEIHIRDLKVDGVIYNGGTIAMLKHNVLNYALPPIIRHAQERGIVEVE